MHPFTQTDRPDHTHTARPNKAPHCPLCISAYLSLFISPSSHSLPSYLPPALTTVADDRVFWRTMAAPGTTNAVAHEAAASAPTTAQENFMVFGVMGRADVKVIRCRACVCVCALGVQRKEREGWREKARTRLNTERQQGKNRYRNQYTRNHGSRRRRHMTVRTSARRQWPTILRAAATWKHKKETSSVWHTRVVYALKQDEFVCLTPSQTQVPICHG